MSETLSFDLVDAFRSLRLYSQFGEIQTADVFMHPPFASFRDCYAGERQSLMSFVIVPPPR